MSELSVDQLREAVEHLHGCSARFVAKHYVEERWQGKPTWFGDVHEFALDGHPTATTAYAWSHYVDNVSEKRRFVAVLHIGKIDSPSTAVRAVILQELRERGR